MGTSWQWPTPEECRSRHPLNDEQRSRHAKALERAARRLAAVICHECDMERQPVHVPVVEFLALLKTAAAWTPPAEETKGTDDATDDSGVL